jgi:HSP20 family molecular chaperone IbpA
MNFFGRLTRALSADNELDPFEGDGFYSDEEQPSEPNEETSPYESDVDGELPIDVYVLDDAIYVKTMTAGVRKEDVEITLTREQITIRATRYDSRAPADEDYVYQELYWGTFERVIG